MGRLETELEKDTRFHRANDAFTIIPAYGGTNPKESFAEYFARHIISPATRLLLRPDMHAYFASESP